MLTCQRCGRAPRDPARSQCLWASSWPASVGQPRPAEHLPGGALPCSRAAGPLSETVPVEPSTEALPGGAQAGRSAFVLCPGVSHFIVTLTRQAPPLGPGAIAGRSCPQEPPTGTLLVLVGRGSAPRRCASARGDPCEGVRRGAPKANAAQVHACRATLQIRLRRYWVNGAVVPRS